MSLRLSTIRPLRNFSLVTQQTSLIDFDSSLVGHWVMAVLEPIFDELQVVAGTAAINANPVNALD